MGRRFKITLEGKSYKVEVTEIGEAKPVAPRPVGVETSPITPLSTHSSTSGVLPPPTPKVGAEEIVVAPMPGTIISVEVKVGDPVRVGEVLLILESMKLENDIAAPKDGVVKEIFVREGMYVKRRERLVAIMG
ncbi:MAG: biotin/lipoyl-binding protein [Dehalococcoidia bacterium]|nr:biotin/lipoyl-binding protein [Dehalococcoidia bacterium]